MVSIVVATFIVSQLVSAQSDSCLTLYSYNGPREESLFGAAVAFCGDVDGDGVGDILVGSVGLYGYNGRVFVFSGATGDTLFEFLSEARYQVRYGDYFGLYLSGVGDINNDGHEDILVGAPNDDEVARGAGRAYLYSGADGATIVSLRGSDSAEALGSEVTSVGDLNGDGTADIFIGGRRGYFLSGATLDTLLSIPGVEHVKPIQDINGDGYDDILSSSRDLGFLISGISGDTLLRINGPYQPGLPFSNFGAIVSSAGDMDGDGLDDILISAPWYSGRNINGGRVYAYSSSSGALLRTFDGSESYEYFGLSLAVMPDINSDGVSEIVIGAPGAVLPDPTNGSSPGRVYIYSGATGVPMRVFAGDSALSAFGFSISTAGDVNSDGESDFLIGAPFHDGVWNNNGRVSVLLGGEPCYTCGDIDGDGVVSDSDVTALVNVYFHGDTLLVTPNAGDVDCDGEITIADIVYLSYFLHGVIPNLCCSNTVRPPDRWIQYQDKPGIE